VSEPAIPFGRPWITDADRAAVLEVLGGSQLAHGPVGRAFEQDFAAFAGEGAHCLATSSCMAALHLAYLALDIGPGDHVLVPAQTHVATVHAVEAVGARPVFVDCDPQTGNVDPDRLEASVGPRTRAIGLVHFVGIPCDMDRILAVAGRHGLAVVEDCALALGARWDGTHVGLLGDAGCFSFYPVKHVTSAEGGMFTTRRADLAARVEKLRAFGVDRGHAERTLPGLYDVVSHGLNYRMSDLNAALGRSQLARLDENLTHRRRTFAALAARLRELDGIEVLDARRPEAASSHYCLSFLLDPELAHGREKLARSLGAAGIGTSIYYPHPVPRLAWYREKYGEPGDRFPHATRTSDASIALPVAHHIGPAEVRRIADAVARGLEEIRT
jgi:dTDP-4-amino-4,6-dideoxygalactose transaminase